MGDLRAALRQLATKEKPKFKTAQVRSLLPDIEACLKNGFTYRQIAKQLSANGFEITGEHLSVVVSRLRKQGARADGGSTDSPPIAASDNPLQRLADRRKEDEEKRFKYDPTEKRDDLI